jgi:hypothetical protein
MPFGNSELNRNRMEYLAWPAVGLVLGLVFLLMFKRNIGGCIDKIQKVERLGVSLANEQSQAIAEPRVGAFQEMMDSVSSALLRQQETNIRDALKAKGITNEQETVKLLTRALAATTLILRWEQIDRAIFGSQLNALVAINAAPTGLTVGQIQGYYNTAAQQNPILYKTYGFDRWIQFLESQKVVVKGGNGYQITADGKEFMAWLVHAGRTHPHPN